MKLRGGFGSAGAGAKSGRSTMTRGGMAKTASERNRRVATLRSAVGDVQTPTVDELRESIRLFRCWWCGRDDLKSLCGHWIKAHGITKAWVIDHLCLPKKTSFICESTRELCSQHGKRRYDPTRLRNKGGPRSLSRFGYEAQRRKVAEHRSAVGHEAWLSGLKNASRISAEKTTKVRACIICGGPFTMPQFGRGGDPRKTCSDACDSERRRRVCVAQGPDVLRRAHEASSLAARERWRDIFGDDVEAVWTSDNFGSAIGMTPGQALKKMAAFMKTGLLRRVGRGQYQLAARIE